MDDTCLSSSHLALELHRAQISDRRVPAFRIVEALDVVEYIGSRLVSGRYVLRPARSASWYGYGVPRGTPRPVIDKISAGFNAVMKVPSVRAALQKQALQPMEPMSADEMAELYAADAEKYAKIIREAGIKLSD